AAEELRKEIAEIAAAEARACARAGRRLLPRVAAHHLFLRHAVLPISAEFVVLLALVGVADDLVGLVQLLELDLGVLVVGIDVGMEFAGELAVGTLDFRRAGLSIDAESFVVVAKFHPEYSVGNIRDLSYYTHLARSISKLRPVITRIRLKPRIAAPAVHRPPTARRRTSHAGGADGGVERRLAAPDEHY